MRYLISGGGTGGHIFPAVSIANALREIDKEADILFVGALGRMEMERVPQAGYKIIGLPVRGFNRKQIWKNLSVLWDLVRSMVQARKIVRDFQPQVGIGVGGYASGAAMKVAAKMGVPILLQEQNGFAGVTNKLLKDDAQMICVAYEGMERFFPKDKIVITGNPVRQDLIHGKKESAVDYLRSQYGLAIHPDRPTLLIIGGSLGARTINQAIESGLSALIEQGIQVIWQTGKNYYPAIAQSLESTFAQTQTTPTPTHSAQPTQTPSSQTTPTNSAQATYSAQTTQSSQSAQASQNAVYKTDSFTRIGESILVTPFLTNMPDLYALADVVVSRAGASSISELCLLGKASILVPSPNVAEDHQTHNAMALVRKDAAILVKDSEAKDHLVANALQLLQDPSKRTKLSENILLLAQKDSALRIAQLVMQIAKKS